MLSICKTSGAFPVKPVVAGDISEAFPVKPAAEISGAFPVKPVVADVFFPFDLYNHPMSSIAAFQVLSGSF